MGALEVTAARKTDSPPAHIIQFAIEASLDSPCKSKRGVAIFMGDDLITTGFNRPPKPFICDGSDACKKTCHKTAVHAEQDALLHAGANARDAEMLHVKTVDGKLVPSMGPSCLQCSKLLLHAGVRGMWLYHEKGWKFYPAPLFHWMSGQAGDHMGCPPRHP